MSLPKLPCAPWPAKIPNYPTSHTDPKQALIAAQEVQRAISVGRKARATAALILASRLYSAMNEAEFKTMAQYIVEISRSVQEGVIRLAELGYEHQMRVSVRKFEDDRTGRESLDAFLVSGGMVMAHGAAVSLTLTGPSGARIII